jgi:hypothetical protein
MPTESTPSDLVAGLHRGEPESQALLKSWCREPIARLVDRLRARHHLNFERELLIERTLHWTAMYLRSREPAEFATMGRDRLVVCLLAKAFKLLTPVAREHERLWPRLVGFASAIPRRQRRASRAVARCRNAGRDHARDITFSAYDIRCHSRPLESVGGDWSGIAAAGDDSLWVIATDVTGHGFPAYLVADGLPHLWGMRRIAELRARGCPPNELLDALSDVLEPVLPEEVFVEATLARFMPAGGAAFSGAGFCRMALRRSGDDRIDLRRIGGPYLGLGSGQRDHPDLAMHVGDQVLMASDGLFEQPDTDSSRCPLEVSLARRATAHLAAGRTLHDAILAVLEETLRGCQQQDDITVVTIGYRQEVPAGRGTEYVSV